MATAYVGEIRMGAWNFAPVGWMFCNGQLLSISEYAALFTLIGTTYGGNGTTTFGLPNLQGRIPVHQGTSSQGTFVIGEQAGTETVTLQISQTPAHTHALNAQSGAGTQPGPANGVWANSPLEQFSTASPTKQMAATSLANTGGSQPHDNLPPYLCVTFVISLFGIFPSRS